MIAKQRLVAAIILPYLLGACTTWRPQELITLPGAILESQPARVRVISPRTGPVVFLDPVVLGDELIGVGIREGFTSQEFMRVQLSEVTEASFRGFSTPRSVIFGAGSVFIVVAMISAYSSTSR